MNNKYNINISIIILSFFYSSLVLGGIVSPDIIKKTDHNSESPISLGYRKKKIVGMNYGLTSSAKKDTTSFNPFFSYLIDENLNIELQSEFQKNQFESKNFSSEQHSNVFNLSSSYYFSKSEIVLGVEYNHHLPRNGYKYQSDMVGVGIGKHFGRFYLGAGVKTQTEAEIGDKTSLVYTGLSYSYKNLRSEIDFFYSVATGSYFNSDTELILSKWDLFLQLAILPNNYKYYSPEIGYQLHDNVHLRVFYSQSFNYNKSTMIFGFRPRYDLKKGSLYFEYGRGQFKGYGYYNDIQIIKNFTTIKTGISYNF